MNPFVFLLDLLVGVIGKAIDNIDWSFGDDDA